MENVLKEAIKKFLYDLKVTNSIIVSDEDAKIILENWIEDLEGLSLIQFERARKKLKKSWKWNKFPPTADLLDRVDDSEGIPLTKFPEPFKITEEIEQKRNSFFDKQRENGVMSPKKGE